MAILIFLISFSLIYFILPKDNHSKNLSQPIELEVNEWFQITDDRANQNNAAIYNNYIVWQDDRNGNWDIYLFDLSNGKEQRITSEPNDQTNPRIFGELIVWKDMRNNWGNPLNFPVDFNSDIYLFDIRTGEEKQVTNNERFQFSPDIYNDKIIWLDYRSGRSEVYMYDLQANQEMKISYNLGNCTLCKMYENTIIWMALINNSNSLFKYDIPSGRISKIDLKSPEEINVYHFNNEFLVWSNVPTNDSNSDIFLYYFLENRVVQITTNDSCQYGPIIANDYILWSDLRNDPDGWLRCPCKNDPEELIFDNWDIYAYSINDKNPNPFQLTKNNKTEFLADAYNNLMVIIQDSGTVKDIFIMKFRS
jgi:beta propeller repeat protein